MKNRGLKQEMPKKNQTNWLMNKKEADRDL